MPHRDHWFSEELPRDCWPNTKGALKLQQQIPNKEQLVQQSSQEKEALKTPLKEGLGDQVTWGMLQWKPQREKLPKASEMQHVTKQVLQVMKQQHQGDEEATLRGGEGSWQARRRHPWRRWVPRAQKGHPWESYGKRRNTKLRPLGESWGSSRNHRKGPSVAWSFCNSKKNKNLIQEFVSRRENSPYTVMKIPQDQQKIGSQAPDWFTGIWSKGDGAEIMEG